MGQAVLERIFDPFFTTKPVGQGTGLGLSAVHGIMRSHDGAITVYSEPGKGTTFRLYFPAVEDALPEAPPARYEADRVRGERVMYVDDEAPLVYLTTRLLQRVGYTVTGFTDAAQAVVAFRNQPQDFDVVVTDIAMPGMSGFAFVRYVRGIRPDIPVIMTSGYVRPEDQDKARELGVRELIVKPDTVEELSAAIDRVFQDR
jgi:CheY-like chemotaxis protein